MNTSTWVERHALRSFDCLINLMLLPELAALEHEGSATPTNYHKYYEGSGIVRCRRGSWSYTILNNSPSFLFFQHGDFTLTVRIGASFCEHRNFVPAALAPKDRHQRLVADGQRPPRKALRPRHGV